MNKFPLLLILYLLVGGAGICGAQNPNEKFYFDRYGKACEESQASYFRQRDSNNVYSCYNISNDKLLFEGRIRNASDEDDSQNIYQGNCRWYYKTGTLKAERSFDAAGLETGLSKYYYESGNLWKEIEYNKGKPANGTFIEYDEDGGRSRIFEEDFTNNSNEWDLYLSEKSSANISGGYLELAANSREGTSRYISRRIDADEYTVEAVIRISDIREGQRVGLLFGFKDWNNYNYVAIDKRKIYIGGMYEGVKQQPIDGMFCSAITPMENNSLKILCNGDKIYYSVNGEVQFSDRKPRLHGSYVGFAVSGTGLVKVDRLTVKEINFDSGRSGLTSSDKSIRSTGSGFFFSSNGYIMTNQHVVDKADNFIVEINKGGNRRDYKAELVVEDKENDLAILKITDNQFVPLPDLKYGFKENGQVDVGAQVFTIGFPHALTGMGKEAKFTDGRISARTGYNSAINSFQSTIPVQPGNSGGPVFNEKGQLVGVINASIRNTDNVSYAVKLNYIRNLIELLPEKVDQPGENRIADLPLEEKIKVLTDYVVLIKVK